MSSACLITPHGAWMHCRSFWVPSLAIEAGATLLSVVVYLVRSTVHPYSDYLGATEYGNVRRAYQIVMSSFFPDVDIVTACAPQKPK